MLGLLIAKQATNSYHIPSVVHNGREDPVLPSSFLPLALHPFLKHAGEISPEKD